MASPLELTRDERIIQACRGQFVERVNPSNILPYLHCLPSADERHIMAVEDSKGSNRAALTLLDHLVTRDDWFRDLMQALRHPEVNMSDLADEFELRQRLMPVRVVIQESTPASRQEQGLGCADNKHCTVPDASRQEQAQESTPASRQEQAQESTPALSAEREKTFLFCIQKMFETIHKPDDIPQIMKHAKELRFCITGIEHGSLIVVFEIKTISQLEELWQMNISGALNKVMERDILSPERVDMMKSMASMSGLELDKICVSTTISTADYECCKVWLTQKQDIIYPCDGTEAVLIHAMLDKQFETTAKSLTDPTWKSKKSEKQEELQLPTDPIHELTEKLTDLDPVLMDEIARPFHTPPSRSKGLEAHFKERELEQSAAHCISMYRRYVLPSVKEMLSDPLIIPTLADLASKLLHVQDGHQYNEVCIDHIINSCRQYLIGLMSASIHIGTALQSLAFTAFGNQLLTETDIISVDDVDGGCQLKVDEKYYHQRFEELGMFQPCPSIDKNLKISLQKLLDLELLTPVFNGAGYHFFSQVLFVYLLTCLRKWKQIPPDPKFSSLHLFAAFSEDAELSLDRALEAYLCYPSPTVNVARFTKQLMMENKSYLPIMDFFLSAPVGVYDSEIENAVLHMLQNTLSHKSSWNFVEQALSRNSKEIDISEQLANLDDESWQVLMKTIQISDLFILEKNEERWLMKGKSSKTALSMRRTGLTDEQAKKVIDNLQYSPQMSKLDLSENSITAISVDWLLKSPALSSLTCLVLKENKEIGRDLKKPLGLYLLPNLSFLDMEDCALNDDGIQVIAPELGALQKLKELNLGHNNMTADGMSILSASLSNKWSITALRLHENPLQTSGSYTLASLLHSLPYLEIINVCQCQLGNIGMSVIMKSVTSCKLKKINLRENQITAGGSLEVFELLTKCHNMQYLDYSNNEITAFKGLKPVDPLFLTRKSSRIDLKVHEKFISAIKASTTWNYITLWKCNIEGVKSWFSEPENTKSLGNLTYLCLQENNMSDAMTTQLSHCLKMGFENLEHLNLRENTIRSNGAINIADGLKGKQFLKVLFLDRNSITFNGLTALVEFGKNSVALEQLDLSYNSILTEERSDLMDMMKCTVQTKGDDTNVFIVYMTGIEMRQIKVSV